MNRRGALGLVIGFRMAVWRVARPTSWILALVALSTVAVVAWVERDAAPFDAASRTLRFVLSLVVPLCCFALTLRAHAHTRPDDAAWSMARWGVPRSTVALGATSAAMAVAAALSLLAVELALAVAYQGRAGHAKDALASAVVVSLAALAYVAMFSLGMSFGRRGRVVWLPLIADFVLGDGHGAIASVFPRSHVTSLAGGDAVLDLSQPQSSAVLVGMALSLAIVAALKAGD